MSCGVEGGSFDVDSDDTSQFGFGSKLRSVREEWGFGLRELSRLVDVDPAYLSRVERDVVPPSILLIESVSDELGCSRFELFEAAHIIELGNEIPAEHREIIKELVDKKLLVFRK